LKAERSRIDPLEQWDVAVAGGLVRFIVDEGRATTLAIVGGALQAFSIIWEAVRS
jgi:hypothetical protein